MINEQPKHSKIDPKDYVFSEETIQSLSELGIILKEIRLQLDEEEAEKEKDKEK